MKQRKAPIKIEPKVFFANERTFLAWMHISIILAGASIAILAFADDNENPASQLYGIVLLPVAMAFIIYSMYQCTYSQTFALLGCVVFGAVYDQLFLAYFCLSHNIIMDLNAFFSVDHVLSISKCKTKRINQINGKRCHSNTKHVYNRFKACLYDPYKASWSIRRHCRTDSIGRHVNAVHCLPICN